MSIKKQAQRFQQQKLAFFTGYMEEEPHKTAGEKPKKRFDYLPPAYQTMKEGEWKSNRIMSNHNTIVLTTGTRNQNLLLIDWDFKEWNRETQTFEYNPSILQAYNDLVEKMGGEVNTYTETTGNGGKHWIYKYDPAKVGFIIAQKEGFIYNGIKCGDIKGENGLIYTAPSKYKDINGEDKYYEVENDMNIAMLPDILLELLPFTKYEPTTAKKNEKSKTLKFNKKKTNTQDTETDSGISSSGEEVSAVVEEVGALPEVKQMNTEYDFVNTYLHCIASTNNNADDYQTWLDVCLSVSLFPQYHQLVHSWAKQSNKYDYNETQKTIESGNGKKTLGSLYYMAMKNKKKYIDLCEKVLESDTEFHTMLSTFNDNDISKYYFKFHKYNYVYDEETNTWYAINNKNIWETYGAYPETLKTQIIGFVVKKLDIYQKLVMKKKKTLDDSLKAVKDNAKASKELDLDVEALKKKVEEIQTKLVEIKQELASLQRNICDIGKNKFIKNGGIRGVFPELLLKVKDKNKNLKIYTKCWENTSNTSK